MSFVTQSAVNLGSMEIALVVSLILFGVVMGQSYTYYRNFEDRRLLRLLVTVFYT